MEKWYKLYREKVPPIQPSLRNKYYQKKLKSITSQMVCVCVCVCVCVHYNYKRRLNHVTRVDLMLTVC